MSEVGNSRLGLTNGLKKEKLIVPMFKYYHNLWCSFLCHMLVMGNIADVQLLYTKYKFLLFCL